MRLSARRVAFVSVLAVVATLLLSACSSGESHELVIEFFDWDPGAGLGGEYGAVFVVDPGFDADPVYVIEESDIESWDDDGAIRFSDEQTRLDLEEMVITKTGVPRGLLFRLSIDDDSYWGWVRYWLSAAWYSPPYLTYDDRENSLYLTPGTVTVNDLTLEEAARQAWLD